MGNLKITSALINHDVITVGGDRNIIGENKVLDSYQKSISDFNDLKGLYSNLFKTIDDGPSILSNNENSEKRSMNKQKYNQYKVPKISKVIFNDPATIVYWEDKTKTVVKCNEADEFDEEKGLAMAIAEKYFGGYMPLKRMVKKYRKVEE